MTSFILQSISWQTVLKQKTLTFFKIVKAFSNDTCNIISVEKEFKTRFNNVEINI